ncbi:Phosphopantetheine adenylyltransferase [Pelotomaculum schinkii]|uniref:Phosphopantetheine adenylyltransferase n=1 Tax=Pelotomaculum schinkii TaxID=78350 RepID=A0A4Y7R9Z1_9FIRM|nr:pantetheine-phosphate adenylyltransferase [Pelotomaculum schinkii]TEB05529.1 Phosphopantetheine adenylyltransferase [Pelotomaculum schinkii]
MRTAICPGSFDPVTYGHLDIIGRAALIFDKLIVAVSYNPGKNPLFSIEERIQLLQGVLSNYPNIEVKAFSGLTVDAAIECKAKAIIRGLRVVSDFENEFRMALTNQKLACHIETVFLMTKAEYSFISSTTVKEVASFGGSLRSLVPPLVEEKLREKFKRCHED